MVHRERGRDRSERREFRDDRRDERREYRRDVRQEVRRTHRRRAIVGTRVRTLPRGCTVVVTGDIAYRVCEGVYYRRYYEGTTVVYVIVEAP